MERLRIGLIGWGTVGAAFGQLIRRGPLPVDLAAVSVRDPSRERSVPLPDDVVIGPPERAIEGVDVVVELAGGLDGPDRWARMALGRGLPYVTANKALLAAQGEELARLAEERRAALLGSASVGGGTPMIEFVQHLATAGGIERLRGVVNATTTYILSAMGAGRSYDDALREAQQAGYAEADPSFDVEGRDAAQKLAVLASVAWGRWRPEREVDASGIVGVEIEPGRIVRLVAQAGPAGMRVGPVELERDDPLARAAGIENVLEVEVGEAGTFHISGPGAGGRVTAGAVYADVARLVAGQRPILFAMPEGPR